MATKELDLQSFQELVNSGATVLVDFWAAWCGPCRKFGPVFEAVSEEHPDIVFGKVDTEAQQDLAGALQIRSIPTLMVFREGILLYNEAGALPAEALKDLVDQVKALDMDEVRAQVEAASQEGESSEDSEASEDSDA